MNKHLKMAAFFCLVLIATIILNEFIHYDFWFQDFLYSKQQGTWLYDIQSPWNRRIFYHGAKIFLGILGVTGIILLIVKRKVTDFPYRKGIIVTLFTLIICPSIVVGGKGLSAIRCPAQLSHYSGNKVYQSLLAFSRYEEKRSEWGKCFPAGHASGGFALVALMNFSDKKKKRFWLAFLGASFGWIMGWHQILRGAHFLTHTFASMWIAFIVAYIIEFFWEKFFVVKAENQAKNSGN